MSLRNLCKKNQGEIATTLTVISVVVMAVGALIGTRLNQESQDTRSFAESSCPYSFSAPSGEGAGRTITCRIPASQTNIPSLGCALAQNDNWVSGSTFIGWEGTVALFSVTLNEGYGDGTYSLIAYKFNSATDTCTHPDQISSYTMSGSGQTTIQPTTPPQTATCTTGLSTEQTASDACGVNSFEPVPGIPQCYRCTTDSRCHANIGLCSNNCTGNNECKQQTSGCWSCVPLPTATATPTRSPIQGEAECTVQYKGDCIPAAACNAKGSASFTILSNQRGCSANTICCAPLPTSTPSPTVRPDRVQPVNFEAKMTVPNSQHITVADGYEVFSYEGNYYTIEYNPPQNKNQYIFEVTGGNL